MLARAAREYDSTCSTTQSKTVNLGKQLFPSSSPNASSTQSRQTVLTPTTTTTANRTNAIASYNNPLKRTASQAGSTSSSQYPPKSSKSSARPTEQSSSGVISKLHEGVFFDENDFVDDDELDLDNSGIDQVEYPKLSSTSQATLPSNPPPTTNTSTSVHYPRISNNSPPEVVKQTPSSRPIEWSSSPPFHKDPPPNAALLRRCPPIDDDSSIQQSNTNENTISVRSKHVETTGASPKKPRTLPWLVDGSNKDEAPVGTKDNEIVKKPGRGRPRKSDASTEPYTPLPNNAGAASHPWNKTASAIKEEQKKYRQQANQSKKLVKEINGDSEPVNKKKSREKKVAQIFLSDEQKRVLALVTEDKQSVFFTGSAGTGKSVLMREIISVLKKTYRREPDRVAVTASTGLAACNVGGVTLHSFAGIGLGKEDVEELVKKIKRNTKAKQRWMRTKVLVIDEISMVDGALFDKLEAIARAIRNNGRPFGGLQLVLTGDFFQLPPVPDKGKVAKFAFDASTWSTSIQHTIGLSHIFRQKDPVFARMLDEMRVGRLSKDSINAFYKLNRKLSTVDDFEATELFPTRDEVDIANQKRMQQLGGQTYTFQAQDSGTETDITRREKLLQHCMAPPTIALKKGAQVMLIKNIDEQLVNGSQGRVIAFMDERTYDQYMEDEDSFQPSGSMDTDGPDVTAAREKLKSMYNKETAATTSQLWPVVRFPHGDGRYRDLLCIREAWKIELPSGEVQALRAQIPLILSWALSIHKAQGQTIERVKVDLGKIFEKGQAYVALSRATSQEGLQIVRFDPRKVMAHEKVRYFYDNLTPVPAATAASTKKHAPVGRSTTFDSRTKEDFDLDALIQDQLYEEDYEDYGYSI